MANHHSTIQQLVERYCDPNRVPSPEEIAQLEEAKKEWQHLAPFMEPIQMYIRGKQEPLISPELLEELERLNRHAALRSIYRLR